MTPTHNFPPPVGIVPIMPGAPRLELQSPMSTAKGKAEMLARWQYAVDQARRHPGTFETIEDYEQWKAATSLCVDYLTEAIEKTRRKSASVGGGPQVVSTPRPFFEFVQARLGIHFGIDLAAIGSNSLCPTYFGPCPGSLAMDALTQDWVSVTGPSSWGWLNPEYKYVLPWVRKARLECERGARIVMLLRLSPGTAWYADQIDGQCCEVLKMRGRMEFPGYGQGANFDTQVVVFDGQPFRERVWDWKAEMKEAGFGS